MKKLTLFLVLGCLTNMARGQIHISDYQATSHFRDSVKVSGKIFGSRHKRNGDTYLNMGGDYPNQLVSILIKAKDKFNFRYQPNEEFINREVEIRGFLKKHRGKPLVVVSSSSQIRPKGFF